MEFINKKTGEIRQAEMRKDGIYLYSDSVEQWFKYDLETLANGWSYYEEPKEDGLDNIIELVEAYSDNDRERYPREIVKKLKAWKRLREKGFRLNRWKEAKLRTNMSCIAITGNMMVDEEAKADLDLLFRGEE